MIIQYIIYITRIIETRKCLYFGGTRLNRLRIYFLISSGYGLPSTHVCVLACYQILYNVYKMSFFAHFF